MNFSENRQGQNLQIAREAVSDLLLSGLCNNIGNRTYEVKAKVREILLEELLKDPNFGPDRIVELADFTLLYANEKLDVKQQLDRTIAEVLRWGALAYIRPEEAAERMAMALGEKLNDQDRSGQLRMSHLLEKLAGPMNRFEAFRDLRRFARGVVQNVAGKGQEAERSFGSMQDRELQIGQVTLQAPELQQVPIPIFFFAYITSPQQTQNMTVLDFDEEHRRIVPYFRRLEEKGLIQIVVQYDLRPVEVENILTDESFGDRIAFLHLSGHASTLEDQQTQSNVQSYSAGFNADGKLIDWRNLVRIFNRYSNLELITLDDVLTKAQLEDLRSDQATQMNKVFNPRMPQELRNMLVIDHNITTADLMPFMEAFYDKLTTDHSINNSFNEAGSETLGQLLYLKNNPVMAWLPNGWWQLSEHPALTKEMLQVSAIPRLSPEDARLLANIGEIYSSEDKFTGYGLLIDNGQFITSYYYLTGEPGEYIRFYQNGKWQKYNYEGTKLIRDEDLNAAFLLEINPMESDSQIDLINTLRSATPEDMPGGEWDLQLIEPHFDEQGYPSLKRYNFEAYVERYSLYYKSEELDALAGLPLLINGKLGGYHFGEMSGSNDEKVGVWWPGVLERLNEGLNKEEAPDSNIEKLEARVKNEPESLEALNELARAYRLSPVHGPEQALPILEQALKIDPDNTFTLNEYGIQLRESGQIEAAIQHFESSLKRDPKNTFALNELGYTYMLPLQNYEMAINYFQQTLEIDPDNIFALSHIGSAFRESGDYTSAYEMLEKARKLAPEDSNIQAQFEQIKSLVPNLSEKIEDIREHIQRGDLDMAFEILTNLSGLTNSQQNQVKVLFSLYQKIKNSPNSKVPKSDLGTKEINEISKSFMLLLDKIEKNKTGALLTDVIKEKEQEAEDAEKSDPKIALELYLELEIYYSEALVDEPENVYWQRQYGLNFEKIGELYFSLVRFDKAEEYFQKEIAYFEGLESKNPDKDWIDMALAIAREKLGDISFESANFTGAEGHYRAGLAVFKYPASQMPDVVKTRGILYQKLGDTLDKSGKSEEAQKYWGFASQLLKTGTDEGGAFQLIELIQNEAIDVAANALSVFAERQEDKLVIPEIKKIQKEWDRIQMQKWEDDQEYLQYNKQRLRLNLLEILLQLEPELDENIQLTSKRLTLFTEVLNFSKEQIISDQITPVVNLLVNFISFFTPGKQEELQKFNEEFASLEYDRFPGQKNDTKNRIISIIDDALFLNQPRANTQIPDEPDMQQKLGELFDLVESYDLTRLQPAMREFSFFLKGRTFTEWEKYIQDIDELEHKETRMIHSDSEYQKLKNLNQEKILYFLRNLRDREFPVG
ncbi:MAG: tetratricopeptide repeat protein [Saprospiraceae bacterium]|nr:tetratricopeptide repeat protein [Saprospiraceae bacterium]